MSQITIIINEPLNQLISCEPGGSQKVVGAVSDLVTVAKELPDASFVLLIDSRHCVSHVVNLPQVKRKDLPQVIPYSIEDQCIQSVETQCIRYIAHETAGMYTVLVCDQHHIDACIARYESLNIPLTAILPLALALPVEVGHWSVLLADEVYHIRQANHVQCGMDASNLSVALSGWFNADDTLPAAVDLIQAPEADWEHPHWSVSTLSPDWRYDSSVWQSSLNLLATSSKRSLSGVFSWKLKGASLSHLVLLLCVAAFGIPLVSWGYLWEQSYRHDQQLKTLYQQVFKTTDSSGDNLKQQSSHLQQAIKDVQIFSVLNEVAEAEKQYPDVTLTDIDYKKQNLLLSLTCPSMATVNQWTKALQAQGVTFDQSVKTKDKDTVLLTVVVKGV